MNPLAVSLLLLLLTGAGTGLLAGLFGIGGGLIMVPALAFLLPGLGVADESRMQTALGTSLAVIACHSISSTRAHHRLGGVLWPVWKTLTPGLIVGSLSGAGVAHLLSETTLKRVVSIGAVLIAVQMALDLKPRSSRPMPGAAGMMAAGGLIGGLSALIGIGGGALTVPFLTWRGAEIRQAIATSAACGAVLAAAGAAGFMFTGTLSSTGGSLSLGYVSLPAFAALVTASITTSGSGAKLAHILPEQTLKRSFAAFLFVVAALLWLT